MGTHCAANMKTGRLNIRLSDARLSKLRRLAIQKDKTITQLIEESIDKMKEEKPS
jgi:predicted transcriptional regulator